MFQIDALIDSNSDDIAPFKKLKGRLKFMRSSAIEKGGETATENLVFKELRNRGYLDKINKHVETWKIKTYHLSNDRTQGSHKAPFSKY